MSNRDHDPLFGDEREEIPLAKAPLTRVLAQVRFMPIMMLRNQDYVAPFQEAIRSRYPQVALERIELPLSLADDEQHDEIHWRFYSADRHWRVSLSPDFLALETQGYTSRADFIDRFKFAVSALSGVVKEASVTRIGVRYVDHVKAPEFDGMRDMLRNEMLGIAASDLAVQAHHSISEGVWPVAEGLLLARWGLLPSHGTHDAAVLTPSPQPSWFLDLDVSHELPEPFGELDPDMIHDTAFALATRSYSFFRWAVTDKFLAVYGGKS